MIRVYLKKTLYYFFLPVHLIKLKHVSFLYKKSQEVMNYYDPMLKTQNLRRNMKMIILFSLNPLIYFLQSFVMIIIICPLPPPLFLGLKETLMCILYTEMSKLSCYFDLYWPVPFSVPLKDDKTSSGPTLERLKCTFVLSRI